jgi:hypothetical protein
MWMVGLVEAAAVVVASLPVRTYPALSSPAVHHDDGENIRPLAVIVLLLLLLLLSLSDDRNRPEDACCCGDVR